MNNTKVIVRLFYGNFVCVGGMVFLALLATTFPVLTAWVHQVIPWLMMGAMIIVLSAAVIGSR